MNDIAEINQYHKAKKHKLTIVYVSVCIRIYCVCIYVCVSERVEDTV